MDQENKKQNIVPYVVIALIVLVVGYYLGGKYGFDIFKTESQKQLEVSEIEETLNRNLDKGVTTTVAGRILSVDAENGTIRFADQTLGAVYKTQGGFVERVILTDTRTLIVKEEVSGGPHFPLNFTQLRAGQFVAVYLAKNDFEQDKAVAKEIILYEYIRLDESVAGVQPLR